MNATANKYIANRATTLAREFLTRRPDVTLHPFDDNELDLVATLDPSASLKVSGFSPFGVMVWGTDKSIASEAAASSFASRRWQSKDKEPEVTRAYFLPVIALLYSVKEDVGYYAWVSEPEFPSDGPPKLIPNERLDCALITRNSLDHVVHKVAEWYTRLASVILSA